MSRRLPAVDAAGQPLAPGDRVRVIGVPDLSSLPDPDPLGSREVFAHLRGTYRRIAGFDAHGHARLEAHIRRGPQAGRHTVWIEPALLRRVRPRPARRS